MHHDMPGGQMDYKAGQCWRYDAPEGFESSRVVIGAIASFSGDARIICFSVLDAPERQDDGDVLPVTIPFLPLSEAAFASSVTALDETTDAAALPEGFAQALTQWRDDPRGLSCFTVAFDGSLDRLIARQMAAIVGTDAA